MSTTLATLEQDCARACSWYAQVTPSATAANTYTWAADGTGSQIDTDDQNATWQFCWARVEADSAATPLNVGEVRRVSTYTASTSTFTVPTDRGFSNAPTATMTIGLYRTVPPAQWGMQLGWKEYINRVLSGIRYRRWGLLTLITDGDMETSGTTNWTAGSSSLTKLTAAANIALGAQALRVANSGANGYARSALVPVTEGDQYELRADVKVASGTAYLVAYDETGAADIETETTTDRDWRSLHVTFTVPADCASLSVRLRGSEASADVYWDNVSLRPAAAHRFDLPSWVDGPEAVEGLVQLAESSVQNEAYLLASQEHSLLPHFQVISDPTGATPWRIEYKFRPAGNALLLVQGLSPYAELSATTDTTVADPDLVVVGACLEAAIDLADDKLAARFGPKWQRRKVRLPQRLRAIPGVW